MACPKDRHFSLERTWWLTHGGVRERRAVALWRPTTLGKKRETGIFSRPLRHTAAEHLGHHNSSLKKGPFEMAGLFVARVGGDRVKLF